MRVRNAWMVPHLPDHFVVELESGEMKRFQTVPYREITKADLQDYVDLHPRRLCGQAMMPLLFKYYGLEKSGETYSEVLKIRVSPSQKEKLETAGRTSEVVRRLIDDNL